MIELIIVAGIAVFFNFAILKWKFDNNRKLDASLDLAVLAIITAITAGTMSGMAIGMIGSMMFSIYLLWKPFRLNFDMNKKIDLSKFKLW